MDKLRIALIFILTIICFSACEKDDICIDGDTPLLVIRFYDAQDTTLVKAVPLLVVKGLDGIDTLAIIPNASLDSITIPLRVDQGSTSFVLSQNLTAGNAETINEDVITFNYVTQELFVSRACGFIINYDGLQGIATNDTNPWISEIRIVDSIVKNSSSAHVKILH